MTAYATLIPTCWMGSDRRMIRMERLEQNTALVLEEEETRKSQKQGIQRRRQQASTPQYDGLTGWSMEFPAVGYRRDMNRRYSYQSILVSAVPLSLEFELYNSRAYTLPEAHV
ncbi:hypothetical protein ACRALDRAFT_2019158 [Sodiomyces alcalophilus JCM 7366]|uniref:uncharacterized protein n=1 Tax=Sodiomyces alcalophilus JCM 7366 TaxID=591952 RepID=UPI0039B649BD